MEAAEASAINSPDSYPQIKSPPVEKYESQLRIFSVRLSQHAPPPPAGGRLTRLRLQVSNDSQFHSVWKRLKEADRVGVIDVHKVVAVCLEQREAF